MKEMFKILLVAFWLTGVAVFTFYALENQSVIYRDRIAVKGF